MKNSSVLSMERRRIIVVVSLCVFTIRGFAKANEVNEPAKQLKGEVQFRYDWIGVNKDRGRFREDNWMTDRSTGGLDWIYLESVAPDKNGYEWLFEGRALYDYDYRMSLLMKKPESHYLKLDFSGLRRYFDGSNEYWKPSGIDLSEISDFDNFVDRRNYNIELGLTPPEGAQWIFGWHRLEKDGKEVLLHGAEYSPENFYGVPVILNVRGITDTIYGEVSRTFADKYNFRIRQEFEQYHSNRFQDWRVRDNTGAIETDEGGISDDHLGYTNWRTMFMFDSFLDKQTYVTADYMYNYLNSNSSLNNPVHDFTAHHSHYYETLDGGISKRTNVSGLGYRRANFLKIPKLDFSAGVRMEDSKTDGSSMWIDNTSTYITRSSLDEVRVAESIRLVYKAIEKTSLSFDADLEQRDLNWDAQDTKSAANFDRKSDTDFFDQIYTFKVVHRFNNALKTTVKFKMKDLERNLTNLYRANTNPDDFPGWLGDYRRTGRELTVKTDYRFNSKTSTTLMYQFVQESFDFELGGKTANHEIHRGAGTISFSPRENLFLVGTFMLENYNIDTPVTGVPTNNVPAYISSNPWDFRGNSYSILLDGTYAFNEKTSATLGFRHTEAMGTVDYAGDYVFDKVGISLKHQFAANQTVGVGYAFYNFNSHDSGSFDDYKTHVTFVTYSYTF